ncbi:MAG: hypothetical protein LBQ58_09360 [Synergistaceae bacterium]|jgi:hypothetical protein|nr:hypothetical protein [Synergistaceae bacterium]
MKQIDTVTVLHNTLKSLAKKPPTRKGRLSYSFIVSIGFEDICGLRAKGYSFRCILDELIEAGFLEEDADVKHFCQAFSREKKKRQADTGLNNSNLCEHCSRKSMSINFIREPLV